LLHKSQVNFEEPQNNAITARGRRWEEEEEQYWLNEPVLPSSDICSEAIGQ